MSLLNLILRLEHFENVKNVFNKKFVWSCLDQTLITLSLDFSENFTPEFVLDNYLFQSICIAGHGKLTNLPVQRVKLKSHWTPKCDVGLL